MEVNYNISAIDNDFLEELRFLRTQKGKYITLSFCTKLESLSHKITKFIIQQNYSNKVIKFSQSQSCEKISDNMVDLCLECIEIYLQKITCPDSLPIDISENTDSSITQILTHVSCDLKSLASHIKFTLYSENSNTDVHE